MITNGIIAEGELSGERNLALVFNAPLNGFIELYVSISKDNGATWGEYASTTIKLTDNTDPSTTYATHLPEDSTNYKVEVSGISGDWSLASCNLT